jgi:hypothetical protein
MMCRTTTNGPPRSLIWINRAIAIPESRNSLNWPPPGSGFLPSPADTSESRQPRSPGFNVLGSRPATATIIRDATFGASPRMSLHMPRALRMPSMPLLKRAMPSVSDVRSTMYCPTLFCRSPKHPTDPNQFPIVPHTRLPVHDQGGDS